MAGYQPTVIPFNYKRILVEAVRFELTDPFEPSVFKTGAINRTLPHFLIWCPRRDSNPQDLVSKTNMYTNSITWAIIYFWYPTSDSNRENFSF